jgi:hypothetical protein
MNTETETTGGSNKPVQYSTVIDHINRGQARTHKRTHSGQTHTSFFLSSSRVTKMIDRTFEHVFDGICCIAFFLIHWFRVITVNNVAETE